MKKSEILKMGEVAGLSLDKTKTVKALEAELMSALEASKQAAQMALASAIKSGQSISIEEPGIEKKDTGKYVGKFYAARCRLGLPAGKWWRSGLLFYESQLTLFQLGTPTTNTVRIKRNKRVPIVLDEALMDKILEEPNLVVAEISEKEFRKGSTKELLESLVKNHPNQLANLLNETVLKPRIVKEKVDLGGGVFAEQTSEHSTGTVNQGNPGK